MNLNKVSNVAVILAAAVVIGGNLYDRLSPVKRPPTTVAQRFLGQPFPLPDQSMTGTTATAVLFVSKSCHFCSDSLPFYKRLSGSRQSRELKIIAVVPRSRETREDGVAYVSEHGLAVDAVLPMSFNDLGVVATPTIVLLDGTGRVRASWTGLLSHEREIEVLSRLRVLCPRCGSEDLR